LAIILGADEIKVATDMGDRKFILRLIVKNLKAVILNTEEMQG
jgi:hypothetical protein